MIDGIEVLGLQKAIALYESFPEQRRPATLHPIYLESDARRNISLQPTFVVFRSQGETWMHSLHRTRIPDSDWWDASSPYGYGGPLSTSDNDQFLGDAWIAYADWMREQRVVVEYVRFHPLPANDRFYGGYVLDNRQVVCIDLTLSDPQAGYANRLCQTIKKAERLGLNYVEIPFASLDLAIAFGSYYRAAMNAIGADSFYLFDDSYFQAFAESGQARLAICTHPEHGENWLAACLLLDAPGVREYHLAATVIEGRSYGASSFALHRAALAAKDRGADYFFLGGGTDRSESNSLLFFKGGFSSLRLPYRTGWSVFHEEGYGLLKSRFCDAWRLHPDRPIFWRMV